MATTTRKRGYSQVERPKTPIVVDKEVSTAESSPTFNGGAVQSLSASTETSPSTTFTEPLDSPILTKKPKLGSFKDDRCSHSDSDPEYEPIKVLKGHPAARDTTEFPIIAKNHLGERKVLWAKMDTGADVNVLALKVIERLGLTEKIEEGELKLREIGGNRVNVDRKIVLSFWAGRKNHSCKNVEFFIPSQKQDSDCDGVPDVLLGLPELRKHHMITIDPAFCNDPEEGLEVVAKRACEEEVCDDDDAKPIFLGTKYPQIKVRK